jgi:hypothetical protein
MAQAEKASPTVDRGGVPFTGNDYKFDGYEAFILYRTGNCSWIKIWYKTLVINK